MTDTVEAKVKILPADELLEAWNEYYRRGERHFFASAKREFGKDWKHCLAGDNDWNNTANSMKVSFGKIADQIYNKYSVDIEHEDEEIRASKILRIGGGVVLDLVTVDGKDFEIGEWKE